MRRRPLATPLPPRMRSSRSAVRRSIRDSATAELGGGRESQRQTPLESAHAKQKLVYRRLSGVGAVRDQACVPAERLDGPFRSCHTYC
jgi:hypothetical protein